MARNHYLILGVPRHATLKAIQEAYRRLAKLYHPDVSGADTADKFREVQEAYETLADVSRRRDYDEQMDSSRKPSHSAASPFRRPPRRVEPTRAPGPGWEGGPAVPETGPVLHLELSMNTAEAAWGGEIAVDLPAVRDCPFCGGRGYRLHSPCRACWGRGQEIREERFILQVPSGLYDGAVVQTSLHAYGLLHSQLVIHVTIR
jgi:molecular chaperone DnaJ